MTTEEIKACFDSIDRQNADLLADIARPDFEGDVMLDPTLNHAQTLIHLADEAVAAFPQGAFPIDLAAPALASTDALLAACAARYGRLAVKPMSQAFHALENLWNYNGPPTHPPAVFTKKVFAAEDKLLAAICAFNQQILAQSLTPKQEPLSAKLDKDTERILKAIRSEGEKPFDKRSPQERRLIDLAAIHYARRRYLDGLDIPKSDCIRHIWKNHGSTNVFRDYASFANAVRYDLDRYYNLDVLIARAKTEHVQPRR